MIWRCISCNSRGRVLGCLLLFGTYFGLVTLYYGYLNGVLQLSCLHQTNSGSESDNEQRIKRISDVEHIPTFQLSSLINLPKWFRNKDWGLRKDLTLEKLVPNNQWPSNDGEELTAWNNFFHATTNGLMLEMGALDGKGWSVSEFFENEAKWRTILIEGNPAWAANLSDNRPDAINFNLVICDTPRTVHFVLGDGVGGIAEFMAQGFLNVFHKRLLTNGHLDPKKLTLKNKVVPVPCVPLSHILYPLNISHINFFMLDVEGGELNVLKAIDFGRITFDVIAVETYRGTDSLGDTKRYMDQVIEFLTSKGFLLWKRRLGRNSWFVSPRFLPFKNQLSTKSKTQN